jgi:hypothetical protein
MTRHDDGPGPRAPGEADAEKLLAIIHASWMAQAACAAAELGIADLLADGPRRSDELAAAAGCHAASLERLMRALCSLELCRSRADDRYELTAMGALLRADAPDSLRAWTIWWGSQLWPVWGRLSYSIRTGKPARPLVTGMKGFEHVQQDAAVAALFNDAMAQLTRLVARAVVHSYDFSGLRRIVDVGGGQGEMLSAVLRAHPVLCGVLFDLPHAIRSAQGHLERAGVADRCELVAGNFFESVPHGGDAYLLKSVIDDWDDGQATAILANCRRAMPDGARLLLIEPLMPAAAGTTPFHATMARVDLSMLVIHGARERTETELRALLGNAGLRVERILPTGTNYSIIETLRA